MSSSYLQKKSVSAVWYLKIGSFEKVYLQLLKFEKQLVILLSSGQCLEWHSGGINPRSHKAVIVFAVTFTIAFMGPSIIYCLKHILDPHYCLHVV